VQGTGSVAKDRQTVLDNTNAMQEIVETGNYDFIAMQEVDTKATRSKGVDMADMLTLDDYSRTYAYNFHSAFLLYPFTAPHGSVQSGLLSLSKYQVEQAYRKELPITDAFFGKFFDLDRCFSVQEFALSNGKTFLFVNIHFTAYDEGGVIRALQLQTLNAFLTTQKNSGNYVLIAGDFNHDIANSLELFPTEQKVPSWVSILTNSDLTSGYSLAAATNAPTCRSTDMAYVAGVSYTVVIDGFIVSDNITVESIKNLDTGFAYSDHNPAQLTFRLNS
jgi:endonuclease/exonuclease/phosphatase family metal-dependent hydrolase